MELKIDKLMLDDPAFKIISDHQVVQQVENEGTLLSLLEKKYQFPKIYEQGTSYSIMTFDNTMMQKMLLTV